MTDRRMLLVHAHPDDECINNGATMARYVDDGVGVTLVTCTAGEMGEVLVPDLSHLAYEEQGGLGDRRRDELEQAMKVLGVTDHRFLGGFGRFHDSGMAWHEDGHAVAAETIPDNAFWHADLTEAADELVKVIREVHIQAHRVAMYASQLAAVPSYRLDLGEPHDVAKIYWTAMSESRMRASLRALREAGDTETFAGMEPDGKLPPFVTPDELISARVDGAATVHRKMDALAKHETQVRTDGHFFAGAESGHSWWSEEFYRLVKGTPGPADADGFEDDLFAGL
jgi:N-acetyl-1-D-myo-inositol-2-amino-2-deoxy-alpha-D-glucopyranoside deacetylase